MAIPPPPPGFTLDTPQAAPPQGLGRPVIRRAPEPVKPQRQIVNGNIVDLDKGTAAPIAGLPKEATNTRQPQAIPGRPGWFMDANGNAFQPKGLPTDKGRSDPKEIAIELRNVIDKAYQAKQKSKEWFATGFGSGLAQKLGGTPAADVDGLLDTIGANTAFEQLQKMREASPTGGALGSITERELDLLKGTISSLKQTQSDEQFQQSMQTIANSYGRVLLKIPGGRQMMIERGWLPKAGGKKPTPPKQGKARVINFDDLPE